MPDAHPPGNPFAAERDRIAQQLKDVKHKLVVLSGKGGVGKSTVAVNLACALGATGRKVGLFDADFHGPSVALMTGAKGPAVAVGDGIMPVETPWKVSIISMSSFLPSETDAVIWRGPMKMSAIQQLLSEVIWGELDYLVIDLPPGTGDEPLSIAQLLPRCDGAIVVTTPQEVALAAVRRSISFCRQVNLKVLGVVENFSGYVCPHCGRRSEPFAGSGGGRALAEAAGAELLAAIPMSPDVAALADAGQPVALQAEHLVGGLYRRLAERMAELTGG